MTYSELNIEERFRISIDWLETNGYIANKKELANKLGYTKQSISEILANRMKLNPYKLRDFCIIYPISPEWILMGTGEMLKETEAKNANKVSNLLNSSSDSVNLNSKCEHELELLRLKLEEAHKIIQEKDKQISLYERLLEK